MPDATYQQGKNDPDGNELLGGTDLLEAVVVDTPSDGRFGTSVSGDGFYGSDRNGNWRVDGDLALVPGVNTFGTLLFGRNRRSWRFNDDEPDADGTRVNTNPPGLFIDDILVFSATGMASFALGQSITSSRRFQISGDFDVQVDFLVFTKSAGTDFEFVMEVISSNLPTGNNNARVIRVSRAGSENWRRDTIDNGVVANVNEIAGGVAAGKLRITRTGTTLEFFYDAGAGWVSLGTVSSTLNVGTDPVHVDMHISGDGPADGSVEVTGFIVNSGALSIKSGWHREGFGSERGTRQNVPRSLAIVTTADSLELLDLDTRKLWTGFNAAANNLILDTVGERPGRAAWSEGLMAVAQKGGGGGYATLVDYARNESRILRLAAAATTGALFRSTIGAAGAIENRNDAPGYTGDDDDYAVRDDEVNDVALFVSSTKLYVAVGHESGCDVVRYDRFLDYSRVVENGLSTVTNQVLSVEYDSVGDLFFLDNVSDEVFSASKATVDAVFDGGTFVEDFGVSLPATPSLDSQRRIHLMGSPTEVWVTADAGVYRSVWPAAFTLEFGESGSGANYEILPDHDKVLAIAVGVDDDTGASVLVASLLDGSDHTIVVVDLTTNAVFGTVPATSDGRNSLALGVRK